MQPTLPLALVLLFCGLAVLVLELFVPSAGVLFVIAFGCIVASVWVGFWVSTTTGLVMLILVLFLSLILPGVFLQLWKRTPIGRRMFLPEPAEDSEPPALVPELESWIGKFGKTITALRPSGLVQLDSQRVDAISDGPVIDRGKVVRVVGIKGSRVVVHLEGDVTSLDESRPGPTSTGTRVLPDFENWESIDDLTK